MIVDILMFVYGLEHKPLLVDEDGAFRIVFWPSEVEQPTPEQLANLVSNPPADYLAHRLVLIKTQAINTTQQWRGDKRAAIGLSAAKWQDLAYAGKAAHCRAWLLDTSQPFGLAREAQVRGLTNLQMAQLIVAQNDAWLDANDQIDAAYTAARATIEAAQSVAEIEAALVALVD